MYSLEKVLGVSIIRRKGDEPLAFVLLVNKG